MSFTVETNAMLITNGTKDAGVYQIHLRFVRGLSGRSSSNDILFCTQGIVRNILSALLTSGSTGSTQGEQSLLQFFSTTNADKQKVLRVIPESFLFTTMRTKHQNLVKCQLLQPSRI